MQNNIEVSGKLDDTANTNKMTKNRLLIIGLLLFILVSCGQTNKPHDKPFDKEAETLTTNFSKSIFSREIINSKEILELLKLYLTLSMLTLQNTFGHQKLQSTLIVQQGHTSKFLKSQKGQLPLLHFSKTKLK